jgi:hypothetical protein
MSTYETTLMLGPFGVAPTHTYTVSSADAAPSEADPVLVLDDLVATWAFPEDQLWPSQPDGQTFSLQLLVDDLSELDDLAVDQSAAYLRVESAGTLVWEWQGVVGAMEASVVRRKVGRKVQVTITVVDPLGALADVLISLDRPAESYSLRAAAIKAAIDDARSVDPQLAPALSFIPDLGGLATDPIYLPELSVQHVRAYDLMVDMLKYLPAVDFESGARYLTTVEDDDPAVMLGSWAVTTSATVDKGLQSPSVPGELALTAHKLGVTFPLDGVGLAMPAGEIEESSLSFAALRYDSVSRVTVNTPDSTTPVVTLSNGLPGRESVLDGAVERYALGGDADYPYRLAKAYLPRPSDIRWTADGFTWRPSDAELVDLEHQLNPQGPTGGVVRDKVTVAPVAIVDLPAVVNPGSDSTFYGGTLTTLTLRIRRGVISFTGKIARRVETRGSAGPAAGEAFVTWADIKANFPAVKTKTGVDVLDPTMSTYELLLARKM